MFPVYSAARRYLRFLLKVNSIQRIHSPFVFKYMSEVVYNKSPYYVFKSLDLLRGKLGLDQSRLRIEDLGAGSKGGSKKKRSVSSILKRSVKRKKHAELLFRMVCENRPSTILELGTSLGLTSIYLSKAAPRSRLITMEGSTELADFAKDLFTKYKFRNIEQIIGNFDHVLEDALQSATSIDFAFVDGNHREEETLKYLNLIMDKMGEDGLIVLDDIHWSGGMESAWERAKAMKRVSLSIDLFEMGILFLFPRKQKEHFRFIY